MLFSPFATKCGKKIKQKSTYFVLFFKNKLDIISLKFLEKGDKMMEKKKIKKFFVRKSTIVISVLLLIVSLVAYVVLQVRPAYKDSLAASVSKEVLLVLISVLGSNLILSIVIETDEKNSLLDHFMANDIISSNYYLKNLSEENKKKLADSLILQERFDGNTDLLEMANSVHKKLIESQQSYYFEECEIKADICEKEDYFEKDVIRRISVVPYNNTTTVRNFPLTTINCAKINNTDALKLQSLTVSGKNIDLKRGVKKDVAPICDTVFSHNGYNEHIVFSLKAPLVLHKQKPTVLVLKYTVRCPKSDIVSTYRTSAPCKSFSVVCRIDPKEKYRLLTSAFGFWDHANGNMNNSAENETHIKFDDWIFTDDGVSIAIHERQPETQK